MLKRICFPLTMLLCLAMLPGCGGQSQPKEEKPIITVTIEPLRYFAEAIAGDRFVVTSMVPKGSSPETYDPTPMQLMELARSKAYFRVGYIGFERTWIEKLADNAPHLQFFDLSNGVELILDKDSAHSHGNGMPPVSHHDAPTLDHPTEGVEPHIWTSAENAQTISANILRALCTIDKANRNEYISRYNRLAAQIEQTDSLVRARLANPEAGKAFMIYHPALSYFARDYGLTQIPIEEGGKEPSPAQLKTLIDTCRRQNVRVIFVQPEFDRRNAQLIAQQTGARIVDINPLDYDWKAQMLKAADELAKP